MKISIGAAAQELGVSIATLRRPETEGKSGLNGRPRYTGAMTWRDREG
jgi:hypothetical protein